MHLKAPFPNTCSNPSFVVGKVTSSLFIEAVRGVEDAVLEPETGLEGSEISPSALDVALGVVVGETVAVDNAGDPSSVEVDKEETEGDAERPDAVFECSSVLVVSFVAVVEDETMELFEFEAE